MRSLDGINGKIQRADENVRNLDTEISVFLLANPHPYRVVKEFQNNGRDYVFKLYGELKVPLRFAVLAGEIIYQLRSSLDHLLWALVEKQGATHKSSHQFPIAATAEEFVEARKRRRIEGVSASAEKLIEAVQPYNAPDPKRSTLAAIDRWCIADKHRLLLVVGGAAQLGRELTVNPKQPGISLHGMSPPVLKRVTDDGVELLRIELSPAYPEFEADMQFPTQVAFEVEGECLPFIQTLTVMLSETVNTVNRFAPEFR